MMYYRASETQALTYICISDIMCILVITNQSLKKYHFTLVGRLQNYSLSVIGHLYKANHIFISGNKWDELCGRNDRTGCHQPERGKFKGHLKHAHTYRLKKHMESLYIEKKEQGGNKHMTGNTAVSKAAGTTGSVTGEGTTRAGYGLNNPTINSNGVTTWDCIYFGNYWQEDTNADGKADKNDAKRPVKWRVLSVNGDDAFLFADQNLDCQEYNDTDTSVTWETCTMRSWLNGYGAEGNKEGKDYSGNGFINHAFTPVEQSAIWTTNVVNNDNPEYSTEGGNDTADQVYLLSIDEVTNPAYGFLSDPSKYVESRRAKNTEYAKGAGSMISTSSEYAGNGFWWLRSPGYSSCDASYVNGYGSVVRHGIYVGYDDIAARPALHLNLSSVSSWSYAGTVTSEGRGKR